MGYFDKKFVIINLGIESTIYTGAMDCTFFSLKMKIFIM